MYARQNTNARKVEYFAPPRRPRLGRYLDRFGVD